MLGVFYCSEKGQAIRRNSPAGLPRRMASAGLPGKPERNAVPTKGDIMAIARAGNRFPASAHEYHILSVHTAVPSKGAAGFFYSTHFYFIPRHITKEYMIFITGVPAIVRVRFFCALMHPPYRGRGPPLRS